MPSEEIYTIVQLKLFILDCMAEINITEIATLKKNLRKFSKLNKYLKSYENIEDFFKCN